MNRGLNCVLAALFCLIGSLAARECVAADDCTPDMARKIWLPVIDNTPRDEWASQPTSIPVSFLNVDAIQSGLRSSLKIQVQAAFSDNGLDVTKDSETLSYPAGATPPRLDRGFEGARRSYVYFLDPPGEGQSHIRTLLWVGGLIHSLHLKSDVAAEVIHLSEHHCFRGAMIFQNQGDHILSLFIWNIEAIDEYEIAQTQCLLAAYFRKSLLAITEADQKGRRFLATCNH